ncbi:hypothetical protein E5676_scaffold121G00340 [Cucumis melo var. makuwa]|uniref:Uncharacterized protein n=1 Tax=Cucumis melo var. makuwa TaxID=1194695 RepID=A0A5A7SUL1_CUCMM|nr:hypothetical protein E6C27_scaffold269G001160 [Cucumis melo var. makuwa]TYK03433.1 hypothetical protein E5676_scaffold121G00340 [Cucumis melo var. makuwa]
MWCSSSWGFTTDLVGDSLPLLGWIRVDIKLNKYFSYISGTVSFEITRLICASFGITRLICKGNARGRPPRGKKDT